MEPYEISFDTLYDANYRPQDVGCREIVALVPRPDGHYPTALEIDAIQLWVAAEFGPSMVEHDGERYFIYPSRSWYCIGTSFYFTKPEEAFAFKMRWG